MELQKTDWNQKGRWKVGDKHSVIVAKWMFSHMTKKNKKLIGGVLQNWFKAKPEKNWLDDSVALLWGFVIEDRVRAYNRAAMSGKLGDDALCDSFTKSYHQHAIGATICELIVAGELDTSEIGL